MKSMPAREWVLSDQTHEFIRSQKWEVAVIPFGATEPHNFHMPYGTDCFQLNVLGDRAVQRAYEKGGKVLLLPTMPFGVETNLLDVPGSLALSVNPSTLLKVIADLINSLTHQGVKKIVLLNGHGGNELKPHIRELHLQTDAFLCVVEWFKIAADQYSKIFAAPGEHADEIETSLGLAYFPELTKPPKPGSGKIRPLRFEGMRKGWISITRPFHLMTADTGLGDPGAATAEKGRAFMDLIVERLGDFLYELATTPIDESFPFKPD
jgi:creatinine amidohydrolase